MPAILLLLALTSAGAAFWLAALTLRHRDIMQMLPLLTQLLMFASPVIYPSSIVPEALRGLYGLNPLVTVIEGARWAVLGTAPPTAVGIVLSSSAALVLFLSGLVMLRRHEPVMSDLV
jgi:lipopolysaccharide transport system permease protein